MPEQNIWTTRCDRRQQRTSDRRKRSRCQQPYPIDKKFEAFNFHVINVADGNDFDQLKAAFDEARTVTGMPTAIITKTVKGKGVSFMENQVGWHGKAPNDEEYAIAMAELEKAGEALCQK